MSPFKNLKEGEGSQTPSETRDDLSTMDEVKIFKDEGCDENEEIVTEDLHADLLEEKSSLINESEESLRKSLVEYSKFSDPFGMGYLMNPYSAFPIRAPFPSFSAPKRLVSPPPAHAGSNPYERHNISASTSKFPPTGPLHPLHPQLSPYGSLGGMDQLAAWQASLYRTQSPYTNPYGGGSIGGSFIRHPLSSEGMLHPQLLHRNLPPLIKSENDLSNQGMNQTTDENSESNKKGPHIKKPLNAFMLYMREMRPVVQAECTLKESAAINQILGRRWHGLSREEQAVYYEKAREERQRHQQLYPHWNARDNYRNVHKPKKRKRDKTDDPTANIKKCRARYGVEQQSLWCKPCRRKKKCIRVQMYLAGHSEQEIEDSCNENGMSSIPSPPFDEGSPQSQAGSEENYSNPSPGQSIPSLDSPSSCGSAVPSDSKLQSFDYKPISPGYRPVGSDPRDSSNPLSVSSMTGTFW